MWDTLHSYITDQLNRTPVPGLALAVAHRGRVIHDYAAGYANLDLNLPATPRSRFGIGSITKSFTAMAVMQLVEAGLLDLVAPVTRYLPTLAFQGADEITLHHLLTHTSGLPVLGTERYYAASSMPSAPLLPPLGSAGRTRLDSTADLFHLLNELDFHLLASPGTVMSYSNEGYILLGAVVEAVGGRPYTEYIQSRILEPLGLIDTRFGSFGQVGGGSRRYTKSGDGPFTPVPDAMEGLAAAAAGGGPQLSTPHDLVRWMELFRRGGELDGTRLLSEEGIRRMTAPHAFVEPGVHYGYGLILDRRVPGVTLLGHTGGEAGVAAHAVVALEQGFAAAAQCNAAYMLPVRLAVGAARWFCGLPCEEDMPHVPAGPGRPLEEYTGTFVARTVGARVRIFIENGGLRFERGGQAFAAAPLGPNALMVTFGPDLWTVIALATDETGGVVGIRTGMRVLTRETA